MCICAVTVVSAQTLFINAGMRIRTYTPAHARNDIDAQTPFYSSLPCFISFEIIEPILVILKIEYRLNPC